MGLVVSAALHANPGTTIAPDLFTACEIAISQPHAGIRIQAESSPGLDNRFAGFLCLFLLDLLFGLLPCQRVFVSLQLRLFGNFLWHAARLGLWCSCGASFMCGLSGKRFVRGSALILRVRLGVSRTRSK